MDPKHKIIASVVTGLTGAGGVAAPLAVNALKSPPDSTDQISMVSEDTRTETGNTNRVNDLNSGSHSVSDIDLEDEDDDTNSRVVTEQDKRNAVQLVRRLRENKDSRQRVRLSRDQRKALMSAYLLVSSFDRPQTGQEQLELSERGGGSRLLSHVVLEDLNNIKWDSEKLNLIGTSGTTDNNWGWSEWEKNPFRHFYLKNGEQTWKEKMQKYSSTQSRDNIVPEMEAEIEFDIADWLLSEIERIQKERSQFFQPSNDLSEDGEEDE